MLLQCESLGGGPRNIRTLSLHQKPRNARSNKVSQHDSRNFCAQPQFRLCFHADFEMPNPSLRSKICFFFVFLLVFLIPGGRIFNSFLKIHPPGIRKTSPPPKKKKKKKKTHIYKIANSLPRMKQHWKTNQKPANTSKFIGTYKEKYLSS